MKKKKRNLIPKFFSPNNQPIILMNTNYSIDTNDIIIKK